MEGSPKSIVSYSYVVGENEATSMLQDFLSKQGISSASATNLPNKESFHDENDGEDQFKFFDDAIDEEEEQRKVINQLRSFYTDVYREINGLPREPLHPSGNANIGSIENSGSNFSEVAEGSNENGHTLSVNRSFNVVDNNMERNEQTTLKEVTVKEEAQHEEEPFTPKELRRQQKAEKKSLKKDNKEEKKSGKKDKKDEKKKRRRSVETDRVESKVSKILKKSEDDY